MDTIQNYRKKYESELMKSLNDYYRNGANDLSKQIQEALIQYRKSAVYTSNQKEEEQC